MLIFIVADTRLCTLPCCSDGRSIRPSVAFFNGAFLLLPNLPRLDCRVSGLVLVDLLGFLCSPDSLLIIFVDHYLALFPLLSHSLLMLFIIVYLLGYETPES